jgi:hypothetical protein
VAVELDPGAKGFGDAGPGQFRFNSRRLDGTFNPGPTPVGFERGTGSGNYDPLLAPGDPLISAPSPFGLIGPGGDTVEFRFDLSILGGDWQNRLGIGISHHWISGVGHDYGGPYGSSYDLPGTWSQAVFAGQMPQLDLIQLGQTMYVSWIDHCNEWTLESSAQLTATSWTPVPFVREEAGDGLTRFGSIPMLEQPKAFFRLRR